MAVRAKLLRLAACLLVVLSVPGALGALAFGLPAQYGQTYLAGLQDKWDALASAPGPRIVVAGGSGAAFGVRCDLLEGELPGYSAVNFGLYAGLGTTVMLELAKPLLREGDIVVFSPEQSAQTLSDFFHAPSMWQAADGRPELLAALDGKRRGAMAGVFPTFAGDKARLYRDGTAPVGEGVYARSSFNHYGDIDCPGRERNVMAGGFDPNMPISFDPALPSEEFFETVNAFTRWCAANGVAVYYRFCPMNAAAADGELAGVDAYAQALRERLDCPILGDPAQAVLDAGWFFDTNFHLNASGAVVNTAILASELKTALGDPTPVGIPLPAMPPMAGAETAEGDNRDRDCFLCEGDGDGLRLVGLTAEGVRREALVLPVNYDGVPVTGLARSVFAGNARIREVVIQGSLRGIEDGAFDGCTALERLVLAQPAPARCAVGAGLLDGTDALVYVPQGRLSAYRTDYFWAPHAARIREGGGAAQPTGPEALPSAPPDVSGPSIRYEGNGGTLKSWAGDCIALPIDSAHLRVNTAQGTHYFRREGYTLTGWNTQPDGGGESIGLGSRTERREGLALYAQWVQNSPEGDFRYEVRDGQAWITGYSGASPRCVIPEEVGGLPVRGVCAGAFRETAFETLVLPPTLYTVEPGAFQGCAVREVTLFDSLRDCSDAGFQDCPGLATLHVNAAASPVYSGSYFSAFSDKYDWLLSLRGRRKLVLASGSSGRYGYDSPALAAAFPDYVPANMGVYAYTNALPQLELVRGLMEEGDVLLSAPEFDAAAEQFCVSNRLDVSFWAMMESNYDAASRLDLRGYSGVFDSLGEYLAARQGMARRNYGENPANYDDEGNRYALATYNQYGDFILPRPNGEQDVCLRHNIADYTVRNITPGHVAALNKVYRTFLERGVGVYFTYTPRNRNSLTEGSTPAARRELHESLARDLCVPVISDIEDSLYAGNYFYLIDSHLSSEGAALRTRRVIEDLRPWLDGTQPGPTPGGAQPTEEGQT